MVFGFAAHKDITQEFPVSARSEALVGMLLLCTVPGGERLAPSLVVASASWARTSKKIQQDLKVGNLPFILCMPLPVKDCIMIQI